MTASFEVVPLEALHPLLDHRKVIDCVRQALIKQAEGAVQSPPPGQLLFEAPRGDCHIKFGHVCGSDRFAIKIASGFYDNPRRGLPVNSGLVLVFDAHSGAPRMLFKDDGWLTAWRTAAATAISAATLAPAEINQIGILGAGLQARLAIEWLPQTLGAKPFVLWSRNAHRAAILCDELTRAGHPVRSVAAVDEVLDSCQIIVTATPSSQPLFEAARVRPGTHLVGVGADSPGKQELPSELFSRAAYVLTDDHTQCLDHGDFGTAVRSGAIAADADTMLGDVLRGKAANTSRRPSDITLVDLTGIAAEDIAIAELFCAMRA